MTVEKTIEKQLWQNVKMSGGLALKLYSSSFLGLPDRIVLMPMGRVYFVELKSTGVKPTKRQQFVHKLLRGMGFDVSVIDNGQDLKLFLERITNEK